MSLLMPVGAPPPPSTRAKFQELMEGGQDNFRLKQAMALTEA